MSKGNEELMQFGNRYKIKSDFVGKCYVLSTVIMSEKTYTQVLKTEIVYAEPWLDISKAITQLPWLEVKE